MIVTTYLHELNNEIWLQLPFEEANYWSSYISWLGSSLFSLASEFSSVDKYKITITFVNQYQLRFPSPNHWSHKPNVQFLSVNWYTIGSWLRLRELNNCECLLCCGHTKLEYMQYTLRIECCVVHGQVYVQLHTWEGSSGESSVQVWQYCPDYREGQYRNWEPSILLYCTT